MATCPSCQGSFDTATFCPRDGTRLDAEHVPGELLDGRYRLRRKVGEGAMGVVFDAEHVHIHRRVAVKLLQRRLVTSTDAIERMRREAQVMSGLGHPNIVDCMDFGTSSDGQVYLVMEWLDGETLDARLERGGVDVATALEVAAQTCAGLAEAHARGVIHRDLKPANLFLTTDRSGALRVKILDFGIAKLAAQQTQLTSTGVLIGTPNYMAPEQAMGEAVDARADVYALGIILYELLVGAVPFQADTPIAVLHQHTARMPSSPSAMARARAIGPALDEVVMTCLAKQPDDRYQTMTDLARAIEDARAAAASELAPPAVEPAPRPMAPTPRPDEPADDDLEADLARIAGSHARRTRVLGVAALAVVVVGVVAAVAVLGSRGGGAGEPDAGERAGPDRRGIAIDAAGVAVAPVAAPDAAIVPAPDAAAPGEIVARGTTSTYAYQARLDPPHPAAGETVVLTIALSDLEAGAAGSDHGLVLRIEVQHFARHAIVHRSSPQVDADGRASVRFAIRAGKHHVSIEPMDGARSLGRARFDVHAAP